MDGTETLNGHVAPFAIFPCHCIVGGRCTCGKACDSPGKHPRTENGLSDATRDKEILARWAARWPQSNCAMATGEINGVVVIDIDPKKGGLESLAELERQYGELPDTVTVNTGGSGLHLIYKYPAGVKIHSRNGRWKGIDIKADGGYIITPPSNHIEGKLYEYAAGRAFGEIELAEVPAWLLALLPQKDKPADPPRANGHATHAPDALQRAQLYVAKADAASEGRRNDAAFQLAGHVRAFGLDEADILSLLETWNRRNNPPLEDSELQKCVASAMVNGTPRPAKESREYRSKTASENFTQPVDATRGQSRKPLERVTFASLRKDNPTLNAPVVDGLLRFGETSNIISYSKVGKSWLAYGLALDIITGHHWLGRFPTAKGKVLYLDNELHRSTIANRFPAVAQAKGYSEADYESDLEVVSLRGNLCSLADLACDLESITPGEFNAIVLDAKYRFAMAGVSENDNAAETLFYNTIDQIAEQTKAAIVLIHHASKGSQSDKRVTDIGSGAGAQSRAADCHIVLRDHEQPGTVVMEAAVRSFKPVEPMALRWEFPLWQPAFGVDPGKLKGRGTRSDERQAEKDREGMDQTIKALGAGALSARQLRRSTGMGEHRQSRIIDLLAADGKLTSTTQQNGAASYEIYQLKQ